MFAIREGKLHSWLEYYNPLVAIEAFGGVAAFSNASAVEIRAPATPSQLWMHAL